jgi:hypothetical protein
MADEEYVSIIDLIQLIIPSLNKTDISSNPQNAEEAAEIKKKRAFRKFSYRGVDLDQYALPRPTR